MHAKYLFSIPVLAVTIALPSAALADDAAKCIQAALNSLQFNVGTVDGQIGKGTQKAFADYKAMFGGPDYPLQQDTFVPWCLHLAARNPVSQEANDLSKKVAEKAVVTINIGDVPREAIDRVEIMDGSNGLLATATELTDKKLFGKDVLSTTFPYVEVKPGATLCTHFYPTWGVKDAAGKLYTGSCDPIQIEFWTAGVLSTTYAVAKR
jgi:peptidoglycan hydrolase-like protein with peptidoglycan-binding domain